MLFIAAYAAHAEHRVRNILTGFLPLLAGLRHGRRPDPKRDFGTTGAHRPRSADLLMFMAGCRWWHLAMLLAPAAAGGYVMLFKNQFRRTECMAFLDPEKYIKTAGVSPVAVAADIMSGGSGDEASETASRKWAICPKRIPISFSA